MIGWLGTALLFAGVYGIGHKRRFSFWLMATGEILWTLKAYQTGQWDLGVMAAAFCLMDLRNWYLWGYAKSS